jgi:hypothetical protein
MDNVQKHNICTNVPSSQTFRQRFIFLDIREFFSYIVYHKSTKFCPILESLFVVRW